MRLSFYRFASHVTQTLLTQATQMVNDEVDIDQIDFDGITDNPKTLKELIVNVHSFLIVNIAGK